MKRTIAALLALLLTFALAPALAEDIGFPQAITLPENTPVDVDLDGDGASERVSWAMAPGEYESVLTLTVETNDAGTLTYASDIIWQSDACVLDLDGDGLQEILLSGDVMSDDYYTFCLHLVDGALYEVLFPDSQRGENSGGYYKYGYGLLTGIDGNRLTLTGSQDMLGTWMAYRQVSLSPAGHFEFSDDGVWYRSLNDLADDDLWEYAALTTAVELPYTDEKGEAGVLAPGTKLIVVSTDKEESAGFITEDGIAGTLAVSRDYERGWGCLIDGISEEECFGYLPYAD